ncbi:cupredoxin family copper-binding protein [Bradyrhizobium sp. STM 3809]|uniref:cupredoxin domain-containing protein n=1 Tax=Bradyrhizobium sp. STM 3809 TaxID=551936 RepID=UPI0002405A15|nr:cupredoxin family copper-binding protein [Bradyrhizobium sp. STM 3809]CCD97528.1 Amicyanin precursor protein [Bradyrhizobium sp. STM 3809]
MLSGRLALLSFVMLAAVSVPAHAATIRITIDKLTFSPASVSAEVGDTVEWVNKDALAHTATARNGDFDVTLPPSKTVSSVLRKAGTVDYYCRYHPNMRATLTIAP